MRKPSLKLCLFGLFALIAVPAAAQTTVQVIPPAPTSIDFVTLRVFITLGAPHAVVERTGNHFRVEIEDNCFILCFPQFHVDAELGPLLPGTYTYEVFFDGSSVASGTFIVASAGIPDAPTLSPAALAALGLILVAAGWVFLGRRT